MQRAASVGGGSGGVAGRGGHEGFDGLEWPDAAARADAGAVEGGSGAGKVKLTRERPALEQAIDESRMEDVASAGGVGNGDAIGGARVELVAIPG